MNTKQKIEQPVIVAEHRLQRGDAVTLVYMGEVEQWTVEAVLNSPQFVRCGRGTPGRDYHSQCFPASSLRLIEPEEVSAPKKKKSAVPKVAKPKKASNVGDAISAVLSEAATIADVWRVAELAGLDLIALREKIGHLSNGLQRMGIGNRLRTMWKKGELNADDLFNRFTGVAQ